MISENHAAVRVGAAATNVQMMKWSHENGWTLPMDIIAVMITYGGSNAAITHGAGIIGALYMEEGSYFLVSRCCPLSICATTWPHA